MKRLLLAATVALVVLPAPASANHILNLDTAYDTRGQCEAASARFSVEDRPSLLQRFPNTFSNIGEVAGLLVRAFPCVYDEATDAWYMDDRRLEVLTSEWFLRRGD
ncbi:hypothetical protein GRI42_13300 [Erythrobacter gaetbuli]|uniref:Uncharacterized protein n=1 Tax=Qipengyuania gaetbuli TaxID=266952 RepID=A0A844Y2N0_9SPHN|nr:hypothetical protein [Qipengyuania gaetbuli]MXO52284.1 hypothetical protein [Qipengyuania gaetbuli]